MPVTIHKKEATARSFLSQHPVGVLATVDPGGDPHAAAIYFIIDDKSIIYFVTKTGTRKADNLRHNNHAQLVVYEAETQTTVQVTGTVTEVTELADMNDIFVKILHLSSDTSGSSIPPISRLDEGDYVTYRLEPKQIRMAVFKGTTAGKYKDIFTTVEQETEK